MNIKRNLLCIKQKNPPRLKTESHASLIISTVFHMDMKKKKKLKSTDIH